MSGFDHVPACIYWREKAAEYLRLAEDAPAMAAVLTSLAAACLAAVNETEVAEPAPRLIDDDGGLGLIDERAAHFAAPAVHTDSASA
jgi:hypothetical protein